MPRMSRYIGHHFEGRNIEIRLGKRRRDGSNIRLVEVDDEVDIHREPRFAIVHGCDRASDHVAHARLMERAHENGE